MPDTGICTGIIRSLKGRKKSVFTGFQTAKNFFSEFLRSQLRYAVLEAQYPKEAKALFAKAEEDAGRRYQRYLEMAEKLKELEKKKND